MSPEDPSAVPAGLRRWFVVHFAVDMVFAVPLLFVPEMLLPLLGWSSVDPLTSRLVGAALMGIGVESLLGRRASPETFRAMLNLKLIWSASAVLGLGIGMAAGGPAMGWVFLAVFALFFVLWATYRVRLV